MRRKHIIVWETLYETLKELKTEKGVTWSVLLKNMYYNYSKKETEDKIFRRVIREEFEEIKKRLSELEVKVLELEEKEKLRRLK